jgi:hypothetical protein
MILIKYNSENYIVYYNSKLLMKYKQVNLQSYICNMSYNYISYYCLLHILINNGLFVN